MCWTKEKGLATILESQPNLERQLVLIMQVQITRTFNVPEGVKSVNQLEEAILDFGRQMMLEVLSTLIRMYERDHYCCHECGSRKVEPRGTKGRQISLVFGEITVARARVFCLECEKLSQPADILLDELEGGRATSKLRELICLSTASWPFEVAQGVLHDLCGVDLSDETMRQLSQKEGQRLIEEQTELAAAVVGSKPKVVTDDAEEFVCVEMDGGYIHSRDNEGDMEGKVGLIYSKREKVGKDRYQLMDKRLVVSFAGSERLGQLGYVEAKEKGIEAAKKKVVLGDGAPWIWTQKEEHFPEATAILDLFHLKRAVWEALRCVELPDTGKTIIGRGIVEALENGQVDVACGLVEGLTEVSEVGKEQLSALLGYIRNNREAIPDYVKLKEEGYPVGSGAMEKQVDLIINRRMKGKQGMTWTRDGADSIAALRVLRLNGDWRQYWDKRKAA